jgi:hypothetical protein
MIYTAELIFTTDFRTIRTLRDDPAHQHHRGRPNRVISFGDGGADPRRTCS